MAYYKFTKAILNGDPIDVYNNNMKRDLPTSMILLRGCSSYGIKRRRPMKINIYS